MKHYNFFFPFISVDIFLFYFLINHQKSIKQKPFFKWSRFFFFLFLYFSGFFFEDSYVYYYFFAGLFLKQQFRENDAGNKKNTKLFVLKVEIIVLLESFRCTRNEIWFFMPCYEISSFRFFCWLRYLFAFCWNCGFLYFWGLTLFGVMDMIKILVFLWGFLWPFR